jgi:hypothetical protein
VFATLLGPLPRPPLDGRPAPDPAGVADPLVRAELEDELTAEALAAQARAGLEPLTDGGVRWADPLAIAARLDGPADAPRWAGPITVEAWRAAASATSLAVKQVLPGPYSLGRRIAAEQGLDVGRLTESLAQALNAEIRALAAAGCSFVEVHEPALAGTEGDDERVRFREAAERLLDGLAGAEGGLDGLDGRAGPPHVSLAIVGGSAEAAGAETIFGPPFASYAFDLRAGPDNWRLITAAPPERGIVAGAMPVESVGDDGPEMLVWAGHYAASAGGRGLARVGLATAGSLAHLSWASALRKLERLGEAARLAAHESMAEIAPHLDPRAVDIRSGALGRYEPRSPRSKPAGRRGGRRGT